MKLIHHLQFSTMTDQLQKIFTDAYTKQLKDGVKSNRTVKDYATGEFEIDDSQTKRIAGLYTPIGLQERMLKAAEKDGKAHGVEAAITLYEGYKNLHPLIASNEAFWAYLCHTELKEFVMQEWQWEKAKNKQNFVLDHYFFGKDFSRNALASLWWGVHLSYDKTREESGEDPYTLTRVFFKNYSLRVTWLKVVLRIENALHGILEFLYNHPEVMESNIENRGLFVSKYFNMLGATKQLSSLSKEFFIREMEKLYPFIMSIHGREDVTRKEAAAIIQFSSEQEDME